MGMSRRYVLGTVHTSTVKGPIQRGESRNREGSGVCSVSSSTSSHCKLHVPPVGVDSELRFVLALPLLQQRLHLRRYARHQVRCGLGLGWAGSGASGGGC
jgi:hypothetical protein